MCSDNNVFITDYLWPQKEKKKEFISWKRSTFSHLFHEIHGSTGCQKTSVIYIKQRAFLFKSPVLVSIISALKRFLVTNLRKHSVLVFQCLKQKLCLKEKMLFYNLSINNIIYLVTRRLWGLNQWVNFPQFLSVFDLQLNLWTVVTFWPDCKTDQTFKTSNQI